MPKRFLNVNFLWSTSSPFGTVFSHYCANFNVVFIIVVFWLLSLFCVQPESIKPISAVANITCFILFYFIIFFPFLI